MWMDVYSMNPVGSTISEPTGLWAPKVPQHTQGLSNSCTQCISTCWCDDFFFTSWTVSCVCVVYLENWTLHLTKFKDYAKWKLPKALLLWQQGGLAQLVVLMLWLMVLATPDVHSRGVCLLGEQHAVAFCCWEASLLRWVWLSASEDLQQPPSVCKLRGGAVSSASSSSSASFLRTVVSCSTGSAHLFGYPGSLIKVSAVLPKVYVSWVLMLKCQRCPACLNINRRKW